MNVLDLLNNTGIRSRKAATTKGGEYHSPCPECGGRDRFHVWPQANNGHGSYWCRQCGICGDNVQFCRVILGMDFRAAAEHCDRTDLLGSDGGCFVPPSPSLPKTKQPPSAGSSWSPTTYELPSENWKNKAIELVYECHQTLLAFDKGMKWLAARGIDRNAVVRYSLGWNKQNLYKHRPAWGLPLESKENGENKPLWIPRGLVIPYLIDNQPARIRIRRPADDVKKFGPKYYALPGSFMGAMILEPVNQAFVFIESELDAIAVAVAAGDLAGAIALGSSSTRPDDRAMDLASSSLQNLAALDAEKVGGKDMKWLRDHVPACDPWPVPVGKDPGEAFKKGVDLRAWIIEGLKLCPAMAIRMDKPENQRESLFSPGLQKEAFLEDQPDDLQELKGLLTDRPVMIIKTDKEIGIRKSEAWASREPKIFRRIAQLVFGPVMDHLLGHPAREINADNLVFGGDIK